MKQLWWAAVVACCLMGCSVENSRPPLRLYRTPGQPAAPARVAQIVPVLTTPEPESDPEKLQPSPQTPAPTPEATSDAELEDFVGKPVSVQSYYWQSSRPGPIPSPPPLPPSSLPTQPPRARFFTVKEIEGHARATPMISDPEKLARELTSATDQQRLKARAIFCWLATHVSYDITTLSSPVTGADSNQQILKRGTATDEEYAYLFADLARYAGLEAEVVRGRAKGYQFESSHTSHTWNAVRIDERWCLVDCTWGAGYINGSGVFQSYYDPTYFAADPVRMSFTHFPDQSRWQLLPKTQTWAEFQSRPRLWQAFFDFNLRLQSHQNSVVECAPQAHVLIGCPSDVVVSAKLVGDSGEQRVEARRRAGGYELEVAPGSFGDCDLKIYAGPRDDDSGRWIALEYQVKSFNRTP